MPVTTQIDALDDLSRFGTRPRASCNQAAVITSASGNKAILRATGRSSLWDEFWTSKSHLTRGVCRYRKLCASEALAKHFKGHIKLILLVAASI
eukprot:6214572-Pleurochrysis_carterae.AAC.3